MLQSDWTTGTIYNILHQFLSLCSLDHIFLAFTLPCRPLGYINTAALHRDTILHSTLLTTRPGCAIMSIPTSALVRQQLLVLRPHFSSYLPGFVTKYMGSCSVADMTYNLPSLLTELSRWCSARQLTTWPSYNTTGAV